MPTACTVCTSSKRKAVEQALVNNAAREVARLFNLGRGAVGRHQKNCMVRAVAQVARAEAVEHFRANEVLEHLRALVGQAQAIVDKAAAENDPRLQLLAIKEARTTLEVLGKCMGTIKTERSASLHLHLEPEAALQLARVYAARHGGAVAETLPNYLPQTLEGAAPPIDQEPIAQSVDSATPEEGHDDGQEDPDA